MASVACGFLNPLLTWLYLIIALFLIFGVLRKIGCNSCYYCKTCTMGFGKIADLFFGEGTMIGVKSSTTLKVTFGYILLGVIPTACILASVAQEPLTVPKVAVQAAILAFLLVSSTRKPPKKETGKNTTQKQPPKRKHEKRYLAVKTTLLSRCRT